MSSAPVQPDATPPPVADADAPPTAADAAGGAPTVTTAVPLPIPVEVAKANEARAGRLSLTDFLDVATLQEIQDSFTAVTRLATTIRDADGSPVTTPTDARQRALSDHLLEQLLQPQAGDADLFSAPIIVEGQELGSITIEPEPIRDLLHGGPSDPACDGSDRIADAASKLGVVREHLEPVIRHFERCSAPNRAASIQFLYLLANAIARLCYDEYQSRKRVEELSVLYRISTALSAHRDLQQVLDTAAQSIAEVLAAKAVAIRLATDGPDPEMVPRAVFNLSPTYLNKGALKLRAAPLFQEAIAGKVVYVEDMGTDERVVYRDDAEREGLVSMLCAGMVFQGKPVGVVQMFAGEVRKYTGFESKLLRAIAQLLAAAIENARLDEQRRESQAMVRQLHLAADVQKRMLPQGVPKVPPFDIAHKYVPSFELGGDFYDFLDLGGSLGIAAGDVVGKGVPASLLMASVRASLRAYAQDVYDLDEIIARVNIALVRDTKDNEFATLWYGVFDPKTMRLTYCNAGHEPPLLCRQGRLHPLDVGGMIVGVDPRQHYEKGLWDLQPGDAILLYTDGLTDAMDFEQRKFGRKRIEQSLLAVADKTAQEILNHILWEMRRFTGVRRSIDDTTLVVLKIGKR